MLPLVVALAALVGPASAACPAGAPVQRDAASLARALEGGAAEVWVAGTVRGDFAISRPLSLRGCEGAVIQGSGRGTVLTARADGVRIENLTIQGSGARVSAEDGALKVTGKRAHIARVAVRDALYGIALEQCRECTLEESRVEGRAELEANQRGDGIKLWEAHGSRVRNNAVSGARDIVVWYSRDVVIELNEVRDGRYGTHFMYAHGGLARKNRFIGNTVGIFVMYSARLTLIDNELAGASGAAGMGVGFKESDAVTLVGNRLVANTIGLYLDNTPRDSSKGARFERNLLALNGVALRLHGSERGATFARNDFIGNPRLLEVDGNGDALAARFEENHWDSYAGYDLNRDGRGDVPYQLKQPASELRSTRPLLRCFHGSAALGLFDAMATAMPFFGSRLVLEDVKPRVRPNGEVPR